MTLSLLAHRDCSRENVDRLARFLGLAPAASLYQIASACNRCHDCNGPRTVFDALLCKRCVAPSRRRSA